MRAGEARILFFSNGQKYAIVVKMKEDLGRLRM
jgi:hypothetical protein